MTDIDEDLPFALPPLNPKKERRQRLALMISVTEMGIPANVLP
jgi:hypothetical protein